MVTTSMMIAMTNNGIMDVMDAEGVGRGIEVVSEEDEGIEAAAGSHFMTIEPLAHLQRIMAGAIVVVEAYQGDKLAKSVFRFLERLMER